MKKTSKLMPATYFSTEYIGELPAEMTLKKTSIQADRREKINHFMNVIYSLELTAYFEQPTLKERQKISKPERFKIIGSAAGDTI